MSREFWLFYDKDGDRREDWFTDDLKDAIPPYRNDGIHVIEYSVYKAMRNLNDNLANKHTVIHKDNRALQAKLDKAKKLATATRGLLAQFSNFHGCSIDAAKRELAMWDGEENE